MESRKGLFRRGLKELTAADLTGICEARRSGGGFLLSLNKRNQKSA